jgi:hypothetical protein
LDASSKNVQLPLNVNIPLSATINGWFYEQNTSTKIWQATSRVTPQENEKNGKR